MGGHALKQVPTRRIQAPEYQILTKELLEILRQWFPVARFELIPCYRYKLDFGDMDILFSDLDTQQLLCAINEQLPPNALVRNGPVTSFDYKQFQVDLIRIGNHESFEFALNYFSYNDLGNFIGRIAHKMGYKFGHNGFYKALRDGTHMFNEILVSDNFDAVLEFLGFDSKRFNTGFDTQEEIFQYVIVSNYFNRDIYLLENRNHAARSRDRKRLSYMKFLDYLREHGNELPLNYIFTHDQQQDIYLLAAFEKFPHFKSVYETALQAYAMSREVHQKFNGTVVSELTGLTGNLLGKFMSQLRSQFESKENFKAFIFNATAEEIITFIESGVALIHQDKPDN